MVAPRDQARIASRRLCIYTLHRNRQRTNDSLKFGYHWHGPVFLLGIFAAGLRHPVVPLFILALLCLSRGTASSRPSTHADPDLSCRDRVFILRLPPLLVFTIRQSSENSQTTLPISPRCLLIKQVPTCLTGGRKDAGSPRYPSVDSSSYSFHEPWRQNFTNYQSRRLVTAGGGEASREELDESKPRETDSSAKHRDR